MKAQYSQLEERRKELKIEKVHGFAVKLSKATGISAKMIRNVYRSDREAKQKEAGITERV